MAAGGGGSISRSEIAARLGVNTNALSRPRQELIDRGFIEAAGHGRLRFTIPGFGAYIRDNA
jgi:predicted transcriptional regulator